MKLTTNPRRIAVIGAGISGLTCAYELQEAGHEVVVFESESQPGGRMATRVKDGIAFDIGADHLCDLYTEMKKYCTRFDIEWEKMRFLKYGIFKSGKILSFHEAVTKLSKLRLAIEYFRQHSVGDFFYLSALASYDTEDAYHYMRRRTGKEVADYFVDAFTSTYQFHRAKEISLGAMLGFLYSIKHHQDKWALYRTKGGMSALPNAFARRLSVRLNAPVSCVQANKEISVDGEAFDLAVLATPAPVTARMYQNPTPAQKELLTLSTYSTTISVAFRVPKAILPQTSIVWVPYKESKMISGYVNELMKGAELIHDDDSLICVWLHEDFAKEIIDKTDSEIFSMVATELKRVCPWISKDTPMNFHDLQKWKQAMPKFAQGHLKRVKEFMATEQGKKNVFFCGDYLNAPWTEGALRCGQRVALQVEKYIEEEHLAQ